ncbi:MAG: MraY family glycosyltransferase, partial [Planctomycetia bacterium]
MLWFCLVLFSAAFTAATLATPWAMSIARRLGAVDAPDGFRKNHRGATPRMGGLAVAFGVVVALVFLAIIAPGASRDFRADFPAAEGFAVAGVLLILLVGAVDDVRGMAPSPKMAGQAVVACLLFAAGFRIEHVALFGFEFPLGYAALPVTIVWFLGCMNIWNLIDGMDGLASGSATIVSLALFAVAMLLGHLGVAGAACALAGALIGFLMFNFHPARVFLGDTGSLFIGMSLGMVALKACSLDGRTTLLLPAVLVMGLPIVDTLLAIIRRWIRHLPWNVADHGHLHHRLLAFGLTPRQASFFLYSFTVVLASAALSSVVMRSDALAVLVAVMGTVGLGTVFAARREERASFLSDLMQRLQSRRLEQRVARVVWESIQRLANCHDVAKVLEVGDAMAARLRCDEMRLYYQRRRTELVAHRWTAVDEWAGEPPTDRAEVGGGERQRVQLRFALTDDRGEHLFVEFKQNDGA